MGWIGMDQDNAIRNWQVTRSSCLIVSSLWHTDLIVSCCFSFLSPFIFGFTVFFSCSTLFVQKCPLFTLLSTADPQYTTHAINRTQLIDRQQHVLKVGPFSIRCLLSTQPTLLQYAIPDKPQLILLYYTSNVSYPCLC